VLTPNEFVLAGDQLVRTCPTWQWSGGNNNTKSYLPANKQFLITRGVACEARVADLEKNYSAEMEVIDDEDGESWLATHHNVQIVESDHVVDLNALPENIAKLEVEPKKAEMEDGFIDVDEFVETGLEEISGNSVDILQMRTYDLSITYDKYYQTPRIWLYGYDEHQCPLTGSQVMEDIMQDYANKTVTIEPHPYIPGNVSYASIHPCKHAEVMKKIVSHLTQGGNNADPTQYLFIFLKFIQSVIPTINYDLTIEVQAK